MRHRQVSSTPRLGSMFQMLPLMPRMWRMMRRLSPTGRLRRNPGDTALTWESAHHRNNLYIRLSKIPVAAVIIYPASAKENSNDRAARPAPDRARARDAAGIPRLSQRHARHQMRGFVRRGVAAPVHAAVGAVAAGPVAAHGRGGAHLVPDGDQRRGYPAGVVGPG